MFGAALVQCVLEGAERISRVSPFDEQFCGTRPQLRLVARFYVAPGLQGREYNSLRMSLRGADTNGVLLPSFANCRVTQSLVETVMLSATRPPSKAPRQVLIVGGSRRSGLVATCRLQVRGVQSVAQTDWVASTIVQRSPLNRMRTI